MNNYKLAICIPSRNEEFLTNTVDDLLKHTGDETHIFVGLDGQWGVKPIQQNERVTVFYVPESIGQRAMTKQLARLGRAAKWFLKIDAHCSVSEDFGIKMIEGMEKNGENVTMAPVMQNLHAFDWVCKNGHRRYQGPSGPCKEPGCGLLTEKDIIWYGKPNPRSTSFCADAEPHFQYFREHTRTEKYKNELKTGYTETFSLQGSCFCMSMDKYFELDPDDEKLGSWGSQGINVAFRTWLSGGRVLINHAATYSHLFRTQGGDFGFPYPNPGQAMERAKKLSKDLFFGNNWSKQVRPLSWLLERFWPVNGWTQADFDNIVEEGKKFNNRKNLTKGIIYYTDNKHPKTILEECQQQLKKANLPIVSCSLEPIDFGKNYVLPLKRGDLTMFKQILKALEESSADIIFMCESDVLYHPSHFEFTPTDKEKIYYNNNVWEVRASDGFAVKYDHKSTSQLCAYRETLLKHYRTRVKMIEDNGGVFRRKMGYEPGAVNRAERVDDLKSTMFESSNPNIDIKHTHNLTTQRWSPDEFRHERYCRNWQNGECPSWGKEILQRVKYLV